MDLKVGTLGCKVRLQGNLDFPYWTKTSAATFVADGFPAYPGSVRVAGSRIRLAKIGCA